MKSKLPYVINENATKATINTILSMETDHGDYYDVTLTFADKDLNPPDSDYWRIDFHRTNWSTDWQLNLKFELDAIEKGTEFYNFLMAFRTSYGLEETINVWRQKYESVHEEILEKQRKIQDLTDIVRWRDARIAELESDYITNLENTVKYYQTCLLANKTLFSNIMSNAPMRLAP